MRVAAGALAFAVMGTNADLADGRWVLAGARWDVVFARWELAEARWEAALRAEDTLEVELPFRFAAEIGRAHV